MRGPLNLAPEPHTEGGEGLGCPVTLGSPRDGAEEGLLLGGDGGSPATFFRGGS